MIGYLDTMTLLGLVVIASPLVLTLGLGAASLPGRKPAEALLDDKDAEAL